jgi:signal transduction histidine kinase
VKLPFGAISLRWRLFLATSITLTALFGVAGWALQRYALQVAGDSLNSEVRASAQLYEGAWRARTQILSATSALIASMSDVRSVFVTQDPKTIRDSVDELWRRVSDSSAVFLVLTPEGAPIATLSQQTVGGLAEAINLRQLVQRFPRQLAGYVAVRSRLYYVVLTPVYVQTSSDLLLLNVLCAGFRIDDAVLRQLQSIAPGSDFAFRNTADVFASTLASRRGPWAPVFAQPANTAREATNWRTRYIVFREPLHSLVGGDVAELQILRPYDRVLGSLAQLRKLLALAWLMTIVVAVLISSYVTRRLIAPIQTLDFAATQIAAGNYDYRVPIKGSDELARLALTFNEMGDSIQGAQAELRRQEQISTIGRLGSSLVHDLRNPLAAIYGGAEMLVDGQLPPEQTDRVARSIYSASRKIQELLRDLLHVSRNAGRNLEVCRVREMVESARDSVTSSLSHMVNVEIPEDREVIADRTRVERVFANLLSNAQEAMPQSGEIRVFEEASNEFVDVFVEDSGRGVPPSIKSRLFEPFVTGKRSGMGLGLALSRRTMQDVGGDLTLVESRNGGACFRVRFRSKPDL